MTHRTHQEYERWFCSLNKLEQARILRDHYLQQAHRADGEWERSSWMKKHVFAAAQVKRLEVLHGNDCPPNFGPDTSKGAATGSLFDEVKIPLDSPRS